MEKQLEVLKSEVQGDEFQAMMQRIEASNAGQEKYARKQYHMSQITAAASIVILGIVIYVSAVLMPKVNATLGNMQLIMTDLEVITSDLADSDLEEMINNVNHLVSSSEKNVQDALTNVNAIDIDSLNKAIKDLSDVVSPLANFFNRF